MYCVYVVATGDLVSTTDSLALIADPLPLGLATKQVTDPLPLYVWNMTLLDFVAPPAARIIPKHLFIQRFTLAEQKEMFGFNYTTKWTAAAQKNIASIMRYLDFLDVINLDDSTLVVGINFFETVSPAILAPGRATQILA